MNDEESEVPVAPELLRRLRLRMLVRLWWVVSLGAAVILLHRGVGRGFQYTLGSVSLEEWIAAALLWIHVGWWVALRRADRRASADS